jgi:hypothetical protein
MSSREVTLPVHVAGDLATVTYGNGVLVVVLPLAKRTSGAIHAALDRGLSLSQGAVDRRARRRSMVTEDSYLRASIVNGCAY